MVDFAERTEFTAVWPLEAGVDGINPLTDAVEELTPFVKGWMDRPAALIAQAAGTVQIMVGNTVETLTLIPVPSGAVIRSVKADAIQVSFQEPVKPIGFAGFSVSGSVAATAVSSASGGDKVLLLGLNGVVLDSETVTVDYDGLAGALHHNEDADVVVAAFSLPVEFF